MAPLRLPDNCFCSSASSSSWTKRFNYHSSHPRAHVEINLRIQTYAHHRKQEMFSWREISQSNRHFSLKRQMSRRHYGDNNDREGRHKPPIKEIVIPFRTSSTSFQKITSRKPVIRLPFDMTAMVDQIFAPLRHDSKHVSIASGVLLKPR